MHMSAYFSSSSVQTICISRRENYGRSFFFFVCKCICISRVELSQIGSNWILSGGVGYSSNVDWKITRERIELLSY